ncbi:MAG TPA: hypothetical protein VFA21_17110, partial [Pyrinomonadaceae bacterium]|nr:hypothetical protein [Pyrinomonadaceae bacterium]
MSRPPLRKQIAFPLLASAVFGLTLYLLHKISGAAFSSEFMTDPKDALQWAMRFVSIAFWLSVAFVVARALNELVFLVFRKRKGYEAPSLMRDLFSLVLYVTAVSVILKLHFESLSFGALLSGSALLGIILGLALQDTLGNLFSGISL